MSKMINHYTFSMKVDGALIDFPATMALDTQYETFLWHLERAQKHQYPIDEPYLYYKDMVMATDVETIVKMGAIITGSIVSLKRYGEGDMIIECVITENTPAIQKPLPQFHLGFIEIVAREGNYRVFHKPILRW